jgi:hypothetical protein
LEPWAEKNVNRRRIRSEERAMAREPEKSGRESGKAKTESSSEAKTASGAAKSGAGAGEDKTEEAKGGQAAIADYQRERHSELKAALAKRSEDGADLPAIAKEFAALWLPHHVVEVDLLIPALEDAEVDQEKRAAVAVRKDMLNILLSDLIQSGSADGARGKLDALSDALDAVIAASQQETEAIGQASDQATLNAVGPEMKTRYERMKDRFADIDEAIEEAMDLLAPQSLSVSSARRRGRRENEMPRYSSTRDRDEQGRFLPEDERGYSRRRGGYRGEQERDEEGRFVSEGRRSRGRDMEEDEGRYGGYRGERERDEEGRFASEGRRSRGRNMDEDEGRYGGGRRSMGREDDEDERRYGSRDRDRGQGGWFGDREGHSEASRRGWERPEHGESGWYGDREGHSEASRRGWRSGRHGESGWYGDREGHSEAARRGWEEGHRSQRRDEDDYRSRSRSEDDDRRYESRRGGGRSDDDDERYGRSGRSRGGHGGWSGDPEGHAEAARKGWEHRR